MGQAENRNEINHKCACANSKKEKKSRNIYVGGEKSHNVDMPRKNTNHII